MRRLLSHVLIATGLLLLLAACGGREDGATPTPTKTQVSAEAAAMTPTTESAPTPVPPTPTATPTTPTAAEATEQAEPVQTDQWDKLKTVRSDRDEALDRGGVVIEIRGAGLIERQSALEADEAFMRMADLPAFEDATVFGLISVVVTNTTDAKANVYPAQGVVVVGREQIDLASFMFVGDDVGGTFFPGVVKRGDIVFALSQTTWDDIAGGTSILFEVNAPSDDSFNRLADQPYTFTYELTPWP